MSKQTSVTVAVRTRWLRKVSVYLWAVLVFWIAFFRFMARFHSASGSEIRTVLAKDLVRELLIVGEALDCGHQVGIPGRFKAIGLVMRGKILVLIAFVVALLGEGYTTELTQDELTKVIHIGELSRNYYESAANRFLRNVKGTGLRARLRIQGKALLSAALHALLGTAYLRLRPGDSSQALEKADGHFTSAADLLTQFEAPVPNLVAAGILTALGAAFIRHPLREKENAHRAIEVLSRAKNIFERYLPLMESPPTELENTASFRKFPFLKRLSLAGRHALRQAYGGVRIAIFAFPDPWVLGNLLPFAMTLVRWQIALAFQHLGDIRGAVENFDLALSSTEDSEFRLAIEVNKGQALMEAFAQASLRRHIDLAVQCFDNVLRHSADSKSLRTYLHAVLGDARACLEYDSRGVLVPEKRADVFGIILPRLREAARIARNFGLLALAHESLFLLGWAYELSGQKVSAFRSLVVASRISERIQKRSRTLRLKWHNTNANAQLHDQLVRLSLTYWDAVKDSSDKASNVRKATALRSAVHFAEIGRTVMLREELANCNLIPTGATENDLRNLFRLRRSWHELELRINYHEIGTDDFNQQGFERLNEQRIRLERSYREELATVQKKFHCPSFDPDAPISAVRYADVRAAVSKLSEHEETALVEYHVTDRGLETFVVFPKRTEVSYTLRAGSAKIARGELEELARRWIEGLDGLRSQDDPMHPAQWEAGYLLQVLNRLRPVVEIPVRAIEEWESETGRRIQRLVVVPHRFLHLVPLHVMTLPDGQYWGERFRIQYVPSASVLLHMMDSEGDCAARESCERPWRTIAISYSSESTKHTDHQRVLPFARDECWMVATALNGALLQGGDAMPSRVKAAISTASYIHFACHAFFDPDKPLTCGLELAPEDMGGQPVLGGPHEVDSARELQPNRSRLTLADIFRNLRLPQARLVVLSACETGVSKIGALQNEFLGLPAGFLYSGARTVVSSLWSTGDSANWLINTEMVRHIAAGVDPNKALGLAQNEVRTMPATQVIDRITQATLREPDPLRRRLMTEEAERILRDATSSPFPYASPFWWAGFVANGL